MNEDRSVAYFSMEIAVDPAMPTYSGGLGILAGDTVRAAADLKVPMVAVTLLHRKGYFYQVLDESGWQTETPVDWMVEDFLQELEPRVTVSVSGRPVQLRAWRYAVQGVKGFTVPVLFLDADLPENTPEDRTLTHWLYGGDPTYRLSQEVVLGFGGVRMLRTLGYETIERFHMNEGHASLLTLELLDERLRASGRDTAGAEDVDAVRHLCVFTTHTPVPAGHDHFPCELADAVVGHRALAELADACQFEGQLNLTYLALNLSHYVNGVAKRHGEVSQHMFASYVIDSITNGVHATTWVCPPVAGVFDRHVPGWREESSSLRYALGIPPEELWEAHQQAKHALIDHVNRETNAGLDRDVFTIGFARRATAYKRPELVFSDPERLRAITAASGPLQFVFAGKAHPQDREGKLAIQRIVQEDAALRPSVRVAYLPNYDMALGHLMVAGCDLWLNTPRPPMEASGTSGMKAAMNGVPSLSILDGWWLEGCIEGVTGWAIGQDGRSGAPVDDAKDAGSLYDKLEKVVLPMYYKDHSAFLEIMRHAVALNGSFFNTHRMLQQYVVKAYFD